eukprot:gene6283-6355_t
MQPNIRPVERADYAQWANLWQAYRHFYQSPATPDVTDATWNRFFDGLEPVHALVAESEGQLVGLVHYIFHRSTWFVGPTCYLQDLYTIEVIRGAGIGRSLIQAVYERAQDCGAARVYWMTHESNEQAQAQSKMAPPIDKYQKLSGMMLRPARSLATHCTPNRKINKTCPTRPITTQPSSDLRKTESR